MKNVIIRILMFLFLLAVVVLGILTDTCRLNYHLN